MPLPSSGQITLDQMHVEVGGTSGTQASINDSDIRSMIGASSGQANLSFSDFYGASSGVTINITISSNTNNYNLWDNKGGTYSAGNTTVNLTINSGVTLGSTSQGGYAFTTGLGWVTGDVINITNNGTIKGKGGNGGAGGNAVYNSSVSNAGNGGTGGPAFRGQFACTVTNNGSVYGGGGGGGGGGSFYGRLTIVKTTTSYAQGGGGGGGGAGVIAGSGGSGGSASGAQSTAQGNTGNAGTATAGGAGGTNAGSGGAGGGLGANGVTGVLVPNNYGPPEAYGNPGTGGVRGYYQVGSVFINGGSGIGGTVGGRSA
jgi:hypothetical protein